jgi:membrane dipeptidase
LSRLRRRAAVVLLGCAVAAAALAAPAALERRQNRTSATAWPVSARARALHARLGAVDLHADTLLWARDPLQRSSRGHVDLPRLRDGGVTLQVFSVVTAFPRGSGYATAGRGPDLVAALAVVQRWPPRTWGSPLERALHQAARLQRAEQGSGGALRRVLAAADLSGPGVGALLALEGSQALEGRLENLDRLHAAGFRMASPAHFADTEISGSAHGVERGGLTPLGRRWLAHMEDLGMVVDLAHASRPAFDEVLALARRPVVVSHTGVRGTCDMPRNLDDAQVRAVARGGGVVGIGFWDDVVCGEDPRAIARAIHHAVRVAGPRHVGLGSDWDGTVRVPFDAAGLPALTQALLDEGLDEETIAAVMGANARRVLGGVLAAVGSKS